jgi:broad specificity phosphatase PhoE
VADRAWDAVAGLAERHEGQSVVAVSHNFVILTLLARALGMDLGNFRRLRHGVAAVSILEVQPDGARVVSINDTCHLPPSG